jgi:NitT/TauT family transport system permease protein
MNRREGILNVVILVVAMLLWWQCVYWLIGNIALTSPLETGLKLWELLRTDWFWGDVFESLHAMVVASLIVVVFGILFGVLLGLHRLSGNVAGPILVTLYSIPKVTLYPIVLLIFGLAISARIAFGVMHGILPLVLFTMAAVQNVAQVLVRSARLMHLSRREIITSVVIPAALPGIVTGLRIGISVTLLGVLIGEMFAAKKGLGFRLMNGIQNNDTATIMAIALLLSAFALTVNYLLLLLSVRQRARTSAYTA